MNQTFWGKHMRSGKDRFAKSLLAICFLLLIGVQLYHSYTADAGEVSTSDDWYLRSKQIMNSIPDIQRIDKQEAHDPAHLEFARQVSQQAEKALIKEAKSQIDLPTVDVVSEERLLVFISYGIPERTLKSIIQDGAANNATFVLQGFHPEATTFRQNIGALRDLIGEMDPIPSVILNPPLFKKWSVDVVPTMVIEKDEVIQARYHGDYSSQWFMEKHQSEPEKTHFGTIGNTWEIAEKNLVDVMKAKMAGIDWAERKDEAMNRYWENKTFLTLEPVVEAEIYTINPSIRVTQDIAGKDGQIVARTGDIVNPLHSVPFTSAIVVFDGTKTKRLQQIKETAKELFPGKRIIYITTQLVRDNGFSGLADIESRLGTSVFLLNDAIKERFQLTKEPAYIDATRSELVIRHIPAG